MICEVGLKTHGQSIVDQLFDQFLARNFEVTARVSMPRPVDLHLMAHTKIQE